jgi:hypothetical protein
MTPFATFSAALASAVMAAGHAAPSHPRVTVQGDSLSVGAEPYFRPHGSYSAAVGRHVYEGLALLPHQRRAHVVEFLLGTNDYLETPGTYRLQLKQALREAGKGRCVVVATIYAYANRPNMNSAVKQFATRKNVTYFDWSAAVRRGRVQLADGVHPANTSSWNYRARLMRKAAGRCR